MQFFFGATRRSRGNGISQSVSHSAFSTDLTEEKDQEGEKDFESEEGEEDDEDCEDDEDEYIHLVMSYLVTKV